MASTCKTVASNSAKVVIKVAVATRVAKVVAKEVKTSTTVVVPVEIT